MLAIQFAETFESDIVLSPEQELLIQALKAEEGDSGKSRRKRGASNQLDLWNNYPEGDNFIVHYDDSKLRKLMILVGASFLPTRCCTGELRLLASKTLRRDLLSRGLTLMRSPLFYCDL